MKKPLIAHLEGFALGIRLVVRPMVQRTPPRRRRRPRVAMPKDSTIQVDGSGMAAIVRLPVCASDAVSPRDTSLNAQS